jgi:mono/diheme cytochrome c family protein
MRATSLAILALSGAVLAAHTARAQERYAGSEIFKTYCASCHGAKAKGDGPLADSLRTRPPDLTRLAARMGGTFQADVVRRIIDGRKPVKGHGGSDMPVWGDAFKSSHGRYSEADVKERIDALVQHLQLIQENVASK